MQAKCSGFFNNKRIVRGWGTVLDEDRLKRYNSEMPFKNLIWARIKRLQQSEALTITNASDI